MAMCGRYEQGTYACLPTSLCQCQAELPERRKREAIRLRACGFTPFAGGWVGSTHGGVISLWGLHGTGSYFNRPVVPPCCVHVRTQRCGAAPGCVHVVHNHGGRTRVTGTGGGLVRMKYRRGL